MAPAPLTWLAASVLAALPTALAGFDATSSENIAVYWGQNSYDQSSGPLAQQRLAYYCANSEIDIIPLAFLDGMTPMMNNFANAGNNCTAFADNAYLLNCPQIEEDIKTCQSTYGKTITLSIGGATYTQGGFSSTSDAESTAELVWEMFGPDTNSSVDRPFGSAVVDGFDFDFESTFDNLDAFASKLRSLMDAAHAAGDKYFYLSAAPQCVYPDASDKGALQGEVYFDYISVQFYNNYCGVQNYDPSDSTQTAFNFDVWDNWAHTVSKNPDVKVFLGIPANSGAAGSGYVTGSQLEDVIVYSKQYTSFGGIMMWDMSQLYANSGYLATIVKDVGMSPTATASPSSSSAASSASSTSSASSAAATSTSTSTSTTGSSSGTVTEWGQCGGEGYTGPTQCASPYTCVEESKWWSSCQ